MKITWMPQNRLASQQRQTPNVEETVPPVVAGLSLDGFVACLFITIGGLGATAAVGGLRVPDLAISGLVMVGVILLATGDSRHLPVAILATWMFAPMVRRVVDWQLGGYTSLTALSLLPMMATSALIIPLYPRLRSMPQGLTEPLLLIVMPVIVMSGVGLARYGPGAIVEAGAWLMPALFLPYFATRSIGPAERYRLLRVAVLLAAAAGVYGFYQFFILPTWDRVWLVQSGMTSSMGRPVPMEIRTWGPLNSAGTAAAVWAIALLTALADHRWRPVIRYPVIGVLLIALCITFVRIGWLMAAGGVIALAAFKGRQGGASIAAAALVAVAALVLALPYLPQGDKISARFSTFSDLKHDTSYQIRATTTADLTEQILKTPFGLGLGYKTKAKIAGTDNNIAAVDNGYADLVVTLGWVGAATYAYGIGQFLARCWQVVQSACGPAWDWAVDLGALGCASLCLILISTFAAFGMLGLTAVWAWCCIGMALSPVVDSTSSFASTRVTR